MKLQAVVEAQHAAQTLFVKEVVGLDPLGPLASLSRELERMWWRSGHEITTQVRIMIGTDLKVGHPTRMRMGSCVTIGMGNLYLKDGDEDSTLWGLVLGLGWGDGGMRNRHPYLRIG